MEICAVLQYEFTIANSYLYVSGVTRTQMVCKPKNYGQYGLIAWLLGL